MQLTEFWLNIIFLVYNVSLIINIIFMYFVLSEEWIENKNTNRKFTNFFILSS